MLERLSFQDIGPGLTQPIEFGQRLNLLTDDNGLGISFMMDAA